MKLPDILKGYLPKKEEKTEYFFSLYLDRDAAAVAVWHIDASNSPKVASFAHAVIADDSWESRIQVVDRLLSAAEDKVGVMKAISKTVFGIPGVYLSQDGNIATEIRPHLKKLSKLLELEPVGFVPLSQAIAFSIKKDEGVPPSVILIGCSNTTAEMSLFRVGQMTHQESFEISDDPAASLEAILKKHQDGEVLPSRILLYGGNTSRVEEIRSKLLKHPWPTRANFLHFPKIEGISVEPLLTAVSLAGASELAHALGENPELPEDETVSTVVAQPTLGKSTAPAYVAPSSDGEESDEALEEESEEAGDDLQENTESGLEVGINDQDEENSDEEPAETESPGTQELDADEEEELEDGIVEPEREAEEIANVEMVTPESLGFKQDDVLESRSAVPHSPVKGPMASSTRGFSVPKMKLPALSFAGLSSISTILSRMPKPKGASIPVIVGLLVLLGIGGILYRTIPRATITVLVASQTVDESTTLSVDPSATVADPQHKIVPGKTQEQSLSGEKSVAVSGKKNVGDPAKGSVVIYNKVTSSKTLPKGTVLAGSGISFTLDSDVSVASASESIGSITFGKTTANVTAKEIGPSGNVAAGTEFSFSGLASTQISARNDTAFTGGTSKQVTVVSRADQDALVKALTDELVAKAKQQLQAATNGEHLIDGTIKTDVTEKTFTAELDQEAKELTGKVTVKVSGVSFQDGDVKAALLPVVEAKIPAGYSLAPEQTEIATSNVSVKKDKSITMTAKLKAVALPKIDSEALKKSLAGKDVKTALEILKSTRGVSGAEFRFTLSPTESRLPYTSGNITITVMVQ